MLGTLVGEPVHSHVGYWKIFVEMRFVHGLAPLEVTVKDKLLSFFHL